MTEQEKREFKDGVISIFKRFNILDHTATIGGLRDDILRYIDSLQEEPVNNNYSALLPCIYNRTLEERVKYCKYCSAACEGRVKEPVSEELEDAANEYCVGSSYSDAVMEKPAFKAGAKWQRQKDEHLIWQISSANYEKGIEEGKQQMMKDAVEAEVEGISKSFLNGSWGYFKVEGNYKNGDKVRVIIIKDE